MVDDRQVVGDLHGLLLVVGHEHGRHVDLVVEPAEPRPQLLAHLRVEGAERLVEQQHPRLDDQRAGERHALALAARELGRVPLAPGPSRRTSSSSSATLAAISGFGRCRTFSPNATFSHTVMWRKAA